MITNSRIGYDGRIGNQMFQYAMLIGVSKKTGHEIGIPIANKETKEDGLYDLANNIWIPYKFDLCDCFNININWISPYDMRQICNQYNEKFFHFDCDALSCRDNTNFQGYFQSFKYFEHAMPHVRGAFQFKEEIYNKAHDFMWSLPRDNKELVAIHVRRGDYLGIPDRLPSCESDYYQLALQQFTDKDYRFVIFSDDINWCKESFGEDENIHYSTNCEPYVDLCSMAMCNHYIIPNSTFSLWAALLNTDDMKGADKNFNKRVVAPKNWFGPALAHNNTKDLLPTNWIKI